MNRWRVCVACCALALLAACSSNEPTTAPSNQVPSSRVPSGPSISPAPSSSTTSTPGAQTITIVPHTGLHQGQMVQLIARGFTPGESLIVIECADKGEQTQQGDCNINAARSVIADANGTVRAAFRVAIGPFGSNNIVCSPTTPCLISVNQPVPSPTEQASLDITFA